MFICHKNYINHSSIFPTRKVSANKAISAVVLQPQAQSTPPSFNSPPRVSKQHHCSTPPQGNQRGWFPTTLISTSSFSNSPPRGIQFYRCSIPPQGKRRRRSTTTRRINVIVIQYSHQEAINDNWVYC